MLIFLASPNTNTVEVHKPPFVLSSFYSLMDKNGNDVTKILNNCKIFLLDSGAYTFMANTKKGNIDFYKYLDKYINFINKFDIKYFFELDIDSIVGYEEVLKMRKILEAKTQKKCIPVWHKGRGIEEYKKLCEEYDYIAIGGLVTKEITRKDYPKFTAMLEYAKRKGCKVHGLGFTSLSNLNNDTYPFYSVDSTSWTSGGRFGSMYLFKNGKLQNLKNNDIRRVNHKTLNEHNTEQWVKFSIYKSK